MYTIGASPILTKGEFEFLRRMVFCISLISPSEHLQMVQQNKENIQTTERTAE